MKGAIGNAMIMNIVITFIIIFFSLLIGSMAYSKAYKTKNYLINMIDKYEANTNNEEVYFEEEWDNEVNEYLGKMGYIITDKKCPNKDGYMIKRQHTSGYDYCIYIKYQIKPEEHNPVIRSRYNYMVLVYMKFDFPIVGDILKLPVTGETKSYNILR